MSSRAAWHRFMRRVTASFCSTWKAWALLKSLRADSVERSATSKWCSSYRAPMVSKSSRRDEATRRASSPAALLSALRAISLRSSLSICSRRRLHETMLARCKLSSSMRPNVAWAAATASLASAKFRSCMWFLACITTFSPEWTMPCTYSFLAIARSSRSSSTARMSLVKRGEQAWSVTATPRSLPTLSMRVWNSLQSREERSSSASSLPWIACWTLMRLTSLNSS
mmetsp:Transcript_29642/g.75096  ORF Transcript_29642/g.75096 Transcript_29642/m.75096 type:complete len:226 (-) Transcript_29642:1067-1744(-)